MSGRFFEPGELGSIESAQQQRSVYQQYAASVNPATASSVAALAQAYPHYSPGTVLSLGQAGIAPDHPVAVHAARAEAKRHGFGWHSVGDLVSGAVGFGTKAVSAATGRGYSMVKAASRTASTVLEATGQTFQGAYRDAFSDGFQTKDLLAASPLLGASHLAAGFKQTNLAAAAQQAGQSFHQGHVIPQIDMGTGFFAGGQVKADQVAAARAASPLIGGHAATVGRYAAHQVFEPGTRAFSILSGLVDATVAVGSDPTTPIGGSSRRAIEGASLLTAGHGTREVEPLIAAGGLNAARKTVLPEKVAEWLDGKQGRQVRQYLATENNFENLRKATGGKIDVQTLTQLADATTDEQVLSVLGPKLGTDIRSKFGVTKTGLVDAGLSSNPITVAGATVRKRLDGVRMLGDMPGTHLDLNDADLAVETLDRFARNVKMAPADVGRYTEAMARATDRNGRMAVVTDMLGHVRDNVLDPKTPAAVRTQMTRMYEDYDKTLRAYAVNEIGENAVVPGAMIDGAGKALPSPHLYNEYINRAVPLPDARELRRATSGIVETLNKIPGAYPAFRSGTALADAVTQTAFKPLVLLRGAWTVRVVGEEQIRMAASGMTSAIAHPLSHIAMAMGKKGSADLNGNLLDASDEFRNAMSRGSGNMRDSRVIYTKHRRIIDRTHPQFHEAVTDEIGKMADDPVMRRVLNGLGPGDGHPNTSLTGLDAVKDWFFNGTGQKFRDEMANAGQRTGERRTFFDVKTNPADPLHSADGYIDSLVQRAKDMTGGDATLMDAVASGAVNGKPLSIVGPTGARDVNRSAIKELKDHLDTGAGPNFAPADLVVHVKNSAANEVLRTYDKAVETMFNTLMSRPTNFLSRSPAFKQFYWKRNAELVGFMHPDVQQVALEAARSGGVDKQVVARMERAVKGNSGTLTAAEADMLSKGFALDSTRKLLYDLSDRSQFFDITRNIFPFGEAWKEVASVWANIGMHNPVVIRRGQQLITGLRAADTNGDGQGFFHTDPQTGEEVFAYPFTGWISEKLTGVPAPLKAPAQGLNLFSSSVLPGFGPVVQIPVGKVLPDRPEWDGIRSLVIPFGQTDTSGGIVESLLPAWAQKARVALNKDSPAQDRQYLNTVMDVSRYLVSTGTFSMDSPEEQDRLLQEAKKQARRLYGIRALAQFFAPSPPSPEFVVKDKNGEGVLAIRLVEEYRKLQDADYTTATQKFIEKFGEGALLTTVSKTTGGTSPTDNAYNFMRKNPDVVRQYRDVYGYFVPRGGAFNDKAYQLELRTGERRPVTPEESLQIANQRLGQMVYNQAKAKVGDKVSAPERAWLSNVRDAIEQQYPGFNTTPANLRNQKLLIAQLVRAADNPTLSSTDAGQGLTQYLKARDDALRLAKERGLTSFASAKKAKDLREGLRTIADQIATEHPDFGEMFDRTFNREMVSDGG